MSRGYDGPEIDDFRDSSWGRERDRSGLASKAGTPFSPKNMSHRVLRPTCVRLGLRPIGWHVLDHSHATWLSESGATIRVA